MHLKNIVASHSYAYNCRFEGEGIPPPFAPCFLLIPCFPLSEKWSKLSVSIYDLADKYDSFHLRHANRAGLLKQMPIPIPSHQPTQFPPFRNFTLAADKPQISAPSNPHPYHEPRMLRQGATSLWSDFPFQTCGILSSRVRCYAFHPATDILFVSRFYPERVKTVNRITSEKAWIRGLRMHVCSFQRDALWAWDGD